MNNPKFKTKFSKAIDTYQRLRATASNTFTEAVEVVEDVERGRAVLDLHRQGHHREAGRRQLVQSCQVLESAHIAIGRNPMDREIRRLRRLAALLLGYIAMLCALVAPDHACNPLISLGPSNQSTL